jgi:membrane associated rhomboid family serine protease
VDAAARRPWITASRLEADEWGLVLTAAGIAHRLEETPEGIALRVAPADVERAERELRAFAQEATGGTVGEPAPFGERRSHAGLAVAGLLASFYGVTGPRAAGRFWFAAGGASAERILGGEPWRAVTALTLHADAPHLLGNAVSAAVFVTALSRMVGPGITLWALLITGAAGNAANALAQGAPHSSVGASTALFGIIGCLVGLQIVRWRARPRARPWVPLAAGLALLAMLGTGRDADVTAHLFGFAAGLPLGMLAVPLAAHRPGRIVQLALALAAGAAVLACWALALG